MCEHQRVDKTKDDVVSVPFLVWPGHLPCPTSIYKCRAYHKIFKLKEIDPETLQVLSGKAHNFNRGMKANVLRFDKSISI
jgi:hypothetical protein